MGEGLQIKGFVRASAAWSIALGCILALGACSAYQDDHPVVRFDVLAWEYDPLPVIDPYVQDGVFEIVWFVEELYAPSSFTLTLGTDRNPRYGRDYLLDERFCDGYGESCNGEWAAGFQYHPDYTITSEGYRAGYRLVDLNGLAPYGETLYFHLDICNEESGCRVYTQAARFW